MFIRPKSTGVPAMDENTMDAVTRCFRYNAVQHIYGTFHLSMNASWPVSVRDMVRFEPAGILESPETHEGSLGDHHRQQGNQITG